MAEGMDDDWTWQWVPTGLIYHSYMAGPHEPRAGITSFSDGEGGAFADATLGGRMGFLRYGNCDPIIPAGWQLDFYGAAIARLDLKSKEDLDACDYVFGLPLTYGNEQWQFKFGYAHLSSHLGDEFMRQQSWRRSCELRSRLAGVGHVVLPDSRVASVWRSGLGFPS